ncbi:hypothetical protein GCM10023157_36510 [Gluconacetobacter asukensis]
MLPDQAKRGSNAALAAPDDEDIEHDGLIRPPQRQNPRPFRMRDTGQVVAGTTGQRFQPFSRLRIKHIAQ